MKTLTFNFDNVKLIHQGYLELCMESSFNVWRTISEEDKIPETPRLPLISKNNNVTTRRFVASNEKFPSLMSKRPSCIKAHNWCRDQKLAPLSHEEIKELTPKTVFHEGVPCHERVPTPSYNKRLNYGRLRVKVKLFKMSDGSVQASISKTEDENSAFTILPLDKYDVCRDYNVKKVRLTLKETFQTPSSQRLPTHVVLMARNRSMRKRWLTLLLPRNVDAIMTTNPKPHFLPPLHESSKSNERAVKQLVASELTSFTDFAVGCS